MMESPLDIQIIVTQEDIDNGIKGSECDCPVALAIKRKFSVDRGIVDGIDIEINGVTYYTPERVYYWIERFDAGLPVQPITFEL